MKSSVPTTRLRAAGYPVRVSYITLIFLMAFSQATAGLSARAQGGATRTEVFTFRPGGQVRIENSRGPTRVEVRDHQSVRVIAEKKGRGVTSLDSSELVLMSAQDTILIQCRQSSQPGSIELMVSVPAEAHVQITGGPWPVEVSGSLASAVVDTTSGNISYQIPKSDNARISMHSARGSVRSTVALEATSRGGAQSLQGQVGDGSASIILNSQSGAITLSPSPYSSTLARAARQPAGPPAAADQTSGRQPASGAQADPRPSFGRGSGPSYRPSSVPPDRQPAANGGDDQDGFGSPQPSAGGGSVNIGGTSSSQDDQTEYSAGPFGRPRHEKKESVGSVGMRARIIPSGVPLGARNSGGSVYDDGGSGRREPPAAGPQDQGGAGKVNRRPAAHSPYGAQQGQPGAREDSMAAGDEPRPEIAPGGGRPSAPPVLRRGGDADPSTAAAPPTAEAAEGAREGKGEEEVVKLDAALVNLNVAATDRSGVALAYLTINDFGVFENGEPQSIEFFKASTAPFNLVLVLDLSGSIRDKLDVVKSAALRFVEAVGKQDRIAVLTFTDEVRVISQFTSDRDLLRKRIKSIEKPDGGTAFYEAMWFALVDTLRGTEGQRNAIVVLSDGVDSSLDRYNPFPTRVTFERLARRLEESDCIVFPIYLDTEYEETFRSGGGVAEAYSIARTQLERMAEMTGGQMFRAQESKDLAGVYKQVAAALRTVYSIGYYPTNSERDGTFRKVRVTVSRPSAAVRTRKGYYAK
jgi:VWFA-related protein